MWHLLWFWFVPSCLYIKLQLASVKHLTSIDAVYGSNFVVMKQAVLTAAECHSCQVTSATRGPRACPLTKDKNCKKCMKMGNWCLLGSKITCWAIKALLEFFVSYSARLVQNPWTLLDIHNAWRVCDYRPGIYFNSPLLWDYQGKSKTWNLLSILLQEKEGCV